MFFCQPAGSSLSPSATKCICSRTSQNLSRFATQMPWVSPTAHARSVGQKLKQTLWQGQAVVLLSFFPTFGYLPLLFGCWQPANNSQCPQDGWFRSNTPTKPVAQVWTGSRQGPVTESSSSLFKRMETWRMGFCSCSDYVSNRIQGSHVEATSPLCPWPFVRGTGRKQKHRSDPQSSLLLSKAFGPNNCIMLSSQLQKLRILLNKIFKTFS